MTVARPHRWGMFAGIVFVVLVVVAFAAVGGSTPELKDSAQKFTDFYAKHHDRQMTAGFLVAIAAAFGGIFVAHLSAYVRSAGPANAWSILVTIGGAVVVGGFFFLATVHVALADAAHHHYTPDSVRTLGALDSDGFLPMAGGMGLLVLGAGAAMLAGGLIPRWLGWLAIVIGVVMFTPAGFIAFLAGGLWLLAISVILFLRLSGSPPAASAPAV